jgi:pilus assembly protein Flp/PilA
VEKLRERLLKTSIEIRYALQNERGQGMVEYALILFLISIGAVVLLTAIGFDVQEVFDEVEEALGTGEGDAPEATGDEDAEPGDEFAAPTP